MNKQVSIGYVVLIVGLLSIIAAQRFIQPETIAAAQTRTIYTVVHERRPLSGADVQKILDQYAADGWELVASPMWVDGALQPSGMFIFKKTENVR